MPQDLENNLKISFSKVKNHILALETEVFELKEVLSKQNELLKHLFERFIDSSNRLQNLENRSNSPISIGSEGVNQSINHLINQSISTKSLNHIDLAQKEPISQSIDLDSFIIEEPIKETEKLEISVEETKEKVEKLIDPSLISKENSDKISDFRIDLGTMTQKKQVSILDKEISSFKVNINKAFSSLSKQELKIFLTLYQLDDDLKGVSYIDLSSKLELTEPCIRGYISTLIKKGLPLTKKKLNNKRTILSINEEFRSLSLKQKLVSLYYEADPRQTTLFDLKL